MGPQGHPWVPTSPCTPGCLPAGEIPTGLVRPVRALRASRRGVAVGFLLAAGALAALVAPLLGPGAIAVIQRRWTLGLLAAAGVRLRRHGAAPDREAAGSLVVANHVSWLDVLALHAVAPVRMLAKHEVRDWPVIGSMAARAGTVFLDRDRLRELPGAVSALSDVVREGGAVGVFPEGTTRCGRALGSFRPAAFQAAVDADVPVQPVALRYSDGGAAFVGDDTLLSSLRRVLPARGVELEVVVLEPLQPRPWLDAEGRASARRDLARRSEAAIGAVLAAGTQLPPAPAVPPELAGAVSADPAATPTTPTGSEVLDRVA